MVLCILWKELEAQVLNQGAHSDSPQCGTELPSLWEALKKQGVAEKTYATLPQGDGATISKLRVNNFEHC